MPKSSKISSCVFTSWRLECHGKIKLRAPNCRVSPAPSMPLALLTRHQHDNKMPNLHKNKLGNANVTGRLGVSGIAVAAWQPLQSLSHSLRSQADRAGISATA